MCGNAQCGHRWTLSVRRPVTPHIFRERILPWTQLIVQHPIEKATMGTVMSASIPRQRALSIQRLKEMRGVMQGRQKAPCILFRRPRELAQLRAFVISPLVAVASFH